MEISINNETKEFKNEALQKAYKIAKEAGYKVFTYVPSGKYITNFHYSDGTNIAYIQADYSGLSISTVHKPNRVTGTGFGVAANILVNDLEDLKEGFINYPNWAKSSDRQSVVKFAHLNDYINKESILKYYFI